MSTAPAAGSGVASRVVGTLQPIQQTTAIVKATMADLRSREDSIRKPVGNLGRSLVATYPSAATDISM